MEDAGGNICFASILLTEYTVCRVQVLQSKKQVNPEHIKISFWGFDTLQFCFDLAGIFLLKKIGLIFPRVLSANSMFYWLKEHQMVSEDDTV